MYACAALKTEPKADKILTTQEIGSKKQLLRIRCLVRMKFSTTKPAKAAARARFENLLKVDDSTPTKFQTKPLQKNQSYKYAGG